MSRRRRPIRALPGWENAVAAVLPLIGGERQELDVVGAFVAPASIDEVTPALLQGMFLGVLRHDEQVRRRREKRAGNVTDLYEYVRAKVDALG